MKARARRILACAGTVGVMTIMTAVPAMADTIDWTDKAAADVNTYANIRKGADINSERVGMLPAGAVVSVVGEENGWIQVESGEISGYIREDLLVSGDEAQQLFEAVYGDGELVGAQPLEIPAEQAAPVQILLFLYLTEIWRLWRLLLNVRPGESLTKVRWALVQSL